MATNYTTKTASLKATTADIRILNAKNITAENISIVKTVEGEQVVTNVDEVLTSLGERISDVTASNTATAAGIKVAPESEGSTVRVISVETGVIEEGNAKVVTGGTVHNAIEGVKNIANAKVSSVTGPTEGHVVVSTDDSTKAVTITVSDIASAETLSQVQETANSAIQTVKVNGTEVTKNDTEVDITAIVGVDETLVNGIKVTKTSDNKVKVEVTTATYTPAVDDTAGSWADESNVAKASDVKAAIADVATAHGKDIQGLQTIVNNLTTTGLTRKVLPDGQTTADITDPKENVIYLVKDADSEAGSYIEYLYVGENTYEAIGSTKTDLSEYAKTTDVNAAIDAIPTVEVVAAANSEEKPNYVTVSSSTTDGKTTFTVASTDALEQRLDTLDKFISGSDGEGISELLAKKVDNVTGGSNGITITTANDTDGRIATLTVTPDTTVTKDSVNVVTSGAVETAISNLKTTTDKKVESITTEDNRITLDTTTSEDGAVKSVKITLADTVATVNGTDDESGTVYTKAQVNELIAAAKPANYVTAVKVGEAKTTGEATVEVEAKTAATHFGSELISASLADSKVTITAAPAKEWSVDNDHKPATGITSVINGKMSDGSTIDDANLIDGTSMFSGCTALTTYIGDLSKLTTGTSMFSGCTALTTFVGNLGSLTNGTDMFAGCKLTEESLIYIIDSLPTVQSGTITVGVADGVDKSSYATEASEKGWTLA